MQSDTASLVALVAAPFAGFCVVLAVGAIVAGRRARRGLRAAAASARDLARLTTDRAPEARVTLRGAAADLSRLRERLDRGADDLDAATVPLRRWRAALARLSPSTVERGVGVMHAISLLSRLALVWRTPTR